MKSSAAIPFKMLNSGQHHLFSRILRTSILTWELPQLFFSNHQPVPDRFHPFTGLSKLPNRKAEDPQLLLNQGPPKKIAWWFQLIPHVFLFVFNDRPNTLIWNNTPKKCKFQWNSTSALMREEVWYNLQWLDSSLGFPTMIVRGPIVEFMELCKPH